MGKQFTNSKKLMAFSITTFMLASTSSVWAATTEYGIKNDSGQTMTITDSTDKTVTATSSSATTPALSYGLYTAKDSDSIIITKGDLHLVTSAANSAKGEFHAYAAYADHGHININTADNGASGLGKKVQLEGDVGTLNGNVNVYLDTSDSYLLGNLKNDFIGSYHLTLANGATWKPAFDNRYGSFYNEDDPATHSKDYIDKGLGDAFTGGITSADDIVLKDGVIDLTWDNTKRSVARELNVQFSGSGTIIINTDITRNPISGQKITSNADYINATVTEADSSVLLKVNYDPGFAKGKSFTGIKDTGLVLSNNGTKTLTVTTTGTAYNAKTFVPTIVEKYDSDKRLDTWTITGYTATKGLGQIPNANVTTVTDGHYALHNLWLDETNSLTKRLGELRDTETDHKAGLWARYNYNKFEAGSGSQADIKANLFQLGYDKDQRGSKGTAYTGAALSYAKGSSNFENGDGNVKETTLSLYHTYIANDGGYYDVVLKGGKFMNDFKISGEDLVGSSSDYSTWAYSLSGEVGKRTTWGDGLYVEPQAEFTLGHMNSADYTTSTGMATKADATNLALLRLGVALGKKYNHGALYARASYYHDFGGGIDITADDVHYTRDVAKNWGEFALGGNFKAGKNCSIYGELTKYVGQLKSPVGVNIGARWTF